MPINLVAALPPFAFVMHPLMTRAPTGIAVGSGFTMTDIFFNNLFCISPEILSRIFGSTVTLVDGAAVVGDAAGAVVSGHACAESADVSVTGCDSTANRSTTAVRGCGPVSDECDGAPDGVDVLLSCPPSCADELDARDSYGSA